MQSLDQLCRAALNSPADQPALEYQGRWVNWDALHRVAEQLTRALQDSGARNHGKIALVVRNRPSAVAAFLGLLAGNHSIRMVYPYQSAEALARDLERIGPCAVVAAAEDFSDAVTTVLGKKRIAAIALHEIGATALKGLEHCEIETGDSGAPGVEILTSGTTGPPKPVRLDYEFIAREIVGKSNLPPELSGRGVDLPPSLLMFPMGNISGIYSTLPPLLGGQRVVLLERFTVEGWHDFVLRFRPAISGMPPAGVQMVLDANIPPQDLSSLKALGTGAAPLDPGVQQAFEERYGIPILLSYGATEFAGPVARMTAELFAEWGERKHGSVGRAMPGVSLRVIHPDTGEPLPAGQEGLLEVISPRIGQDWIRTADLARIDEDGFLFLHGRADGAIMRGGFKLLPADIEHALLQHPAISHASVVGVPDRRLGQVPAAAIECGPGATPPMLPELESHLRARIPATHIPALWQVVDALPRTPSMKVDLPAVRRLFATPGDDN